MAPKLLFLSAVFLLLLVQPCIVNSRTLKPNKSSLSQLLNTIENVSGCRKGQSLEGLHVLKQYLNAIGYFPNGIINPTDDFDDSMESALKTYQQFYKLNITGELDYYTINHLRKPRFCGVPDHVHVIPKSDPTANSTSSMFHSKYAFFIGMPKWPKERRALTYSLGSSAPDVVDPQVMLSALGNAFRTWQNVAPFTFAEADTGTVSDIEVGFYRGPHNDEVNFDGRGGITAHAFEPTDGRIHFDADELWSNAPNNQQMDIETIALHEIGHILGMAHSGDTNAVMYAIHNPGQIQRVLTQDDVDGIHALYVSG